jgi:two-component system sensor histidine kinase/response regulator
MMPEGLERIRNARILVVEDSLSNQTLARDLLLHAGAHVDLAQNGREAIAAIEHARQPYDAVLMDLQMPIMDGLEATGIIRSELAQESLPIIATTANVGRREHMLCLEAGANDCLPKPFHIHELYAVLIRWLQPLKETALPDAIPGEGALAADNVTLPSHIEGIDVVGGLARTGNKRELYARLLIEFASANAGVGEKLDNAARQEDWEHVRFLAHGIRSTAGSIGASALSVAAGDMEGAITDGLGGLTKRLANFRVRLDAVLGAIGRAGIAVSSSPAAQGSTTFDKNAAAQSIERLSALLDDQDLAAKDEFEHLSEMIGDMLGDALAELSAAIESLEFAHASEILVRVSREIML